MEYFNAINDLNDDNEEKISPWLLRFKIDDDPLKAIFDEHFEFNKDVVGKIDSMCNSDVKTVQIVSTPEFGLFGAQVIRMRPMESIMDDDGEGQIMELMRSMANDILHELILRGFPNITKVSYTSNASDCNMQSYNPVTGGVDTSRKNWIIETDGCDL